MIRRTLPYLFSARIKTVHCTAQTLQQKNHSNSLPVLPPWICNYHSYPSCTNLRTTQQFFCIISSNRNCLNSFLAFVRQKQNAASNKVCKHPVAKHARISPSFRLFSRRTERCQSPSRRKDASLARAIQKC